MAILKNLIVNGGASRFIGTSYFQDVSIAGSAALASLSLSGNLSVTGNTTLGGTLGVTGAATFSGTVTTNGTTHFRAVEIYDTTPYIDFHYNNSTADYTSRIIETASGTLKVSKNLQVGSAFAAQTATINDATISGDLTVNGVLQANDFIKNIVKAVGGQLYVSPTFQATSSTTVTCTAVTATQLSLTLSDNAINGTDYAGATWYKDSKVMLSGTITANTTGHTEEIIFSSVPGVVTANMSSSNKLQIKLDYDGASTYFKTGTLTTSDVAVMMYQINIPSGSTNAGLHPIGIYIKAYGTDNKNSYIDIFGGTSNTPNARLGLLTGLSAMQNGTTPSGWGIATTNGFFDGTIVSSSGKIGAFTLGSDLRSGTWGTSGSVLVAGGYTPTTADAKSIGGSPTTGNTWAFTAGNAFGVTTAGKIYASDAEISGKITATSGTIGGWSIDTDRLATESTNPYVLLAPGIGTNKDVFYVRTGSGTTADPYKWPIVMRANGYFYADNATIAGKVTANTGYIGGTSGWAIAAQELSNGTIGKDDSLFLATKNLTSSTSIGARPAADGTDWRFTIGSHFGVTNTGTLYANSVHISGAISATSGTIGGVTANNSYGLYTNGKSSDTSTKEGFLISKNGAIYLGAYDSTNGACPFQVTEKGALTATSGKIGGWTLDDSSLYTGTKTKTSSIIVSSADVTRTINGASRTGLRLVVGSNFGVTNTGALYAASGQIGPWHVTTTSIYKGANTLGSTTSGAAYFGNLGLSIGNKFKVDASGDGAIILGELSEGKTHIEIDSDSFDVCYGASTGSSAVKVATFGEITRIGNGGSNVLIDGSGFSFTNTDGVEMMKISTDNVVIGKHGSSYFYVDSSSITLKDNENADVFKVESGGGVPETGTYTEHRGAKFRGNEFNNGCDIQRYDNGVRSSANKVWLRFYKKYTYQVIIEGTTYTRTGLRLHASKDLPSTYYQSGYDPNTLVSVHISGGNNGGTKYINDLVDQYCDSTNPTFDIMFSATCKTPSYANLNMDGNMVVTGSIAADKIQSNEIEATGSLTAPGLIFSPTGMNINEVQTANKNVTITSSNKIDSKPAIGASLTLQSGVYLLVAHGDFNSGSSSGIRTNQIAIYTGTNPVNTDLLNASRVRVTNAAAYWSGLTTHAIVIVPFNTGNTYTVGLTSSIAQLANTNSSTTLQAIYLQPTYPDPDD